MATHGWIVILASIPVNNGRDDGLALSLRGLLLWSLVPGLAGYLVLASLLAWCWHQNPYNRLGWSDAVLYPLRRDEISSRKGQAFLAAGTELWRGRKFHSMDFRSLRR